MKKELNKKIILISGIGKGLGKAFFQSCIDNGAFVIGFTRSTSDLKKIKIKYLKQSKILLEMEEILNLLTKYLNI